MNSFALSGLEGIAGPHFHRALPYADACRALPLKRKGFSSPEGASSTSTGAEPWVSKSPPPAPAGGRRRGTSAQPTRKVKNSAFFCFFNNLN